MFLGALSLHKGLPHHTHRVFKKVPAGEHVAYRLNWTKAFIEDKAPGGLGSESAAGRPASRESSLIVLDYSDVASRKDLSSQIEQALGTNGLGALVISNVPGYVERRRKLLPLASAFASLPDEEKAKYEDVLSHYSVGWSHGKEYLANGQRDLHKGSFYANPLVDDQLRPSLLADTHPASCSACSARVLYNDDVVQELRRRYPGYYRPNVWPTAELPELEPAFKELGRLVCAVGLLLAEHCDSYVSSRLGTPRGQLSGVLERSLNPKARLLHYFAAPAGQTPGEQQPAERPRLEDSCDEPGCEHEQPWCSWHSDHGSLTGLTAAIYLDAAGNEVPSPDPRAGLYIRNRHGQVVRAFIPPDCIAFQVGEALQVHSGGLLTATPHYVRAAKGPGAEGVSRSTFAVFMQPDVKEPMDCPSGVDPQQVAVGQWRPGLNFGEFAEATFEHYYPKLP